MTAQQLGLSVYEEEAEKQTSSKVYTKEDYSVVNRFESEYRLRWRCVLPESIVSCLLVSGEPAIFQMHDINVCRPWRWLGLLGSFH